MDNPDVGISRLGLYHNCEEFWGQKFCKKIAYNNWKYSDFQEKCKKI